MDVRVVCGFSETMASLLPVRAFSNVDFPALGRPMMETNPERCSGMGLRFSAAYAHLFHPQFVAGDHFNSDSFALHRLARARNMAQPLRRQASDGSGFGLFLRTEIQQVMQA